MLMRIGAGLIAVLALRVSAPAWVDFEQDIRAVAYLASDDTKITYRHPPDTSIAGAPTSPRIASEAGRET